MGSPPLSPTHTVSSAKEKAPTITQSLNMAETEEAHLSPCARNPASKRRRKSQSTPMAPSVAVAVASTADPYEFTDDISSNECRDSASSSSTFSGGNATHFTGKSNGEKAHQL